MESSGAAQAPVPMDTHHVDNTGSKVLLPSNGDDSSWQQHSHNCELGDIGLNAAAEGHCKKGCPHREIFIVVVVGAATDSRNE